MEVDGDVDDVEWYEAVNEEYWSMDASAPVEQFFDVISEKFDEHH